MIAPIALVKIKNSDILCRASLGNVNLEILSMSAKSYRTYRRAIPVDSRWTEFYVGAFRPPNDRL